jgi:hypothetical protein
MGDFDMKPAEEIERFVKHLSFRASRAMDEDLWANIARAGDGRTEELAPDRRDIRRFIMRISTTRIAIAALICVAIGAGAVVAVNVGQYFYLGRDDGGHRFISDDGQSVVTMDDADVPDVEQARNDLQEMKLLSEQGKREVIRAIEITVNGRSEPRLLVYKYQLADGRTREMGEVAPGEAAPEHGHAYILTDAQNKEMIRLKEAGPGEDLGTYEEEIMDRMFEFKQQRYVLSDRTEVIWSVGTPQDGQ